jgi:hypothetical protein
MVEGFECAAAEFKNGKNKKVDVIKFRADGDEKEWAKENLSLQSFPTILLFPEGRSGYVKLGLGASRRRESEHFRRVRRREALRGKERGVRGESSRRGSRARVRNVAKGAATGTNETVFDRHQKSRLNAD